MKLDPTINLGHMIIVASGVAGLVGTHYLSDYRLAALERQVTAVHALITDGAVTAERVKQLERRLEYVERR